MSTNLPAPADDQQLRYAEALCRLLALAGVSDVCTWIVHAEGLSGQLSGAYDDREAYHRIRDLAGRLDGGQVVTRPEQTDPAIVGARGPFVAVEARGAVDGTPVQLWTHLHDPDLRQEVTRR